MLASQVIKTRKTPKSNNALWVAEQGRTAMISLRAVDAEFVGSGSDWPKILQALHEMQLVSWEDVCHTDFLWNFGRLINNTDMHLGNLSLGIKGKGFKLLPIYDMCSMGFAPKSGSELSPYRFSPPEISALNLDNKTMLKDSS
ncbi:MAG: hypothetical protein Q9N68_05355 [Gammaproteobacteria bacterium]|nr:hypothetical protein [Gammaproteobacteria bacterium]